MSACQSCGAALAHEVRGFGALPRVTSDSKPFAAGGRLFVCQGCGLVQKADDAAWRREIESIYADYEMYHQSSGIDQPVFDPVSGHPAGRCEVLARRLLDAGLRRDGRLLDVGAGSGAMIQAASAAWPAWRLFAMDLDDRKDAALRAIPRFERLFTCRLDDIPEAFELITLIHSLEHLTTPRRTLEQLGGRLAPAGMLFVEVNNAAVTPFDLLVADHLCHFTPASLGHMISGVGFDVAHCHTDWIGKEISLVAVRGRSAAGRSNEDPAAATARTEGDVRWLHELLAGARALAASGRFGIFGTSVAATWLASALDGAVEFFVDEDPARRGRTHLGRPILTPAEAPPDARVYLAFIPEAAAGIMKRLGGGPLRLVAPPARS